MATEQPNLYQRLKNAIKPPPTGEMVSSKKDGYSGFDLGDYNPDDLIGRKGIGIYYKMRKDEQVKAALLIKKFAVLAGGWDIEPGSEARKDVKAADYVKYALNRMEGSFAGNLLEVLTGIEFGYSITEKNYIQYADGPYSGMWGLKSLKTKEPDEFTFHTDKFDNLLGIKQGYEEKIYPKEKFLIYSYNKEFGNWYGKSDLREAYRSWWSKNNIIKWWNMLLERFGIPPIIGKYHSPEQRSDLQTILERLQSKTTATMPKDVEVEMIEAAMRGADVFELAIRYHDGGIAKAILLPSLSGFAEQSGVGSYAQASKQFDAFMWVIRQIQNHIAEAVMGEQLIRYLVDLNMEVNEYPKLVFPPLSDEQLDYIFNLWFVAIEKRAVVSTPEDEKHIRKSLGFPERKITEGDIPPVIPPEKPPEQPPATPQPEEPGKPEGTIAQNDYGKGIVYMHPITKMVDWYKTYGLYFDNDTLELAWDRYDPGLEEYIKQKHAGSIDFDKPATEEEIKWLNGMVRKFQKSKPLSRQPNKYEKKVNFAQVAKDMDTDQAKVQKDMTAILERSRKGLVKWLEPRLWQMKIKDVKDVNLKNTKELTEVFKKFTTEAYTGGGQKAKAEVKKELAIKSPGPLPAKQAIIFFAEKANFYVTGIAGRLEGEIQQILYNGLKTGEGIKAVTEKINDAFKPYLGDPTAIVDDKVIDPFRLETVIRTNYTEAYNWGRRDMFNDPDLKDFIIGIQYSSILDERTTDICSFLDQKIFKPDSESLDRLTSPNHYNCRSVIVPITKDEGPVEFITEAEINRALTLKQKGF